MNALTITRREVLAGLAATTALPFITPPAFAQAASAADAQANALLDPIAENLLRESPEGATSLGIDKGERAWMRSRLGDRSGIGQQRLAQMLRSDLARANAIDTSALSHSTRTSVQLSAAPIRPRSRTSNCRTAMSVGGWRNTPYVVIQNVRGLP